MTTITTMRRYVMSVALATVLLLCVTALQATADDDMSCYNASLKGRYGTLLTGTIVGFGPIAGVGVATYDGAGHWSRTETNNINGNTLRPETIPGTYKALFV